MLLYHPQSAIMGLCSESSPNTTDPSASKEGEKRTFSISLRRLHKLSAVSRPLSACIESEENVRVEAEVPFVEILHRDVAVFFEEVGSTPALALDALE